MGWVKGFRSPARHASECVSTLAAQVGVEVKHERLWFRYQGRYSEVIHAS